MLDIINLRKLNSFPTKNELESLSIDELYSIAKRSKEFQNILIEFISSNGFIRPDFNKEDLIIKRIEMSVGLRNCLFKGDFLTLNVLRFVHKKELMSIKNFGKKKLEELTIIMKKYNIPFENNLKS
jgi:DNA-directed RNA polymerase alpha subunit